MSGGGGPLGFFGSAVMVLGFVVGGPLGIGLAIAGGGIMAGGAIWAGQDAKKRAQEAMDDMRRRQEYGLRANTMTTQRAIPVVVGEALVGGNIVYMAAGGMRNPAPNVIVANQDLYMVFGISEGPIEGFREVWANDVKVWDVNSGLLQTPLKDNVYFDFRTGISSQAPFTQINSIDAAFANTYPDTAVALVRLRYDYTLFQSIPKMSFLVRGIKVSEPGSPSAPKAWTTNPALVLHEAMVNPRWGWGLPSSKIDAATLASARSYCGEAISAFSDEIVEMADNAALGPRLFQEACVVPGGSSDASFSVTSLSWYFTVWADAVWPSVGAKPNPSRIPVRPGSLTLWVPAPPGANNVFAYHTFHYHDLPSSGTNSRFGAIVNSGTATVVGSVDYLTGQVSFTFSGHNVPPTWNWGTVNAAWFANWGGTYRTKYQFLARSLWLECGSERLTETASYTYDGSAFIFWAPNSGDILLTSSEGGWGKVDYAAGAVDFFFGGIEWQNNGPAYVHYTLNAASGPLSRFRMDGLIEDAPPAMDLFRQMCQHFRGFMVYADGKYKLKVDRPGSSIYSFNDSNIRAGTFKVQLANLSDQPNRVVVKHVDALAGYTPTEARYDVGSPEAAVDMRIEQTLVLPWCAYRDQAYRVAQTLANQVLFGTACEFETGLDAVALEPGDIVDVTHPACDWQGKLFRICGISDAKETKEGVFALSLVEHDDSAYTDTWIGGALKSPLPSAFPRRSYWPPAVSSLYLTQAVQSLPDGTRAAAVQIEASVVSGHAAGLVLQAMYLGAGNRPWETIYDGPPQTYTYFPVRQGGWTFRAYAKSDFGLVSARPFEASIEVDAMDFVNRRMVLSRPIQWPGQVPGDPSDSPDFCFDGRFATFIKSGSVFSVGKLTLSGSVEIDVSSLGIGGAGGAFGGYRSFRHYRCDSGQVALAFITNSFDIGGARTDIYWGVLNANSPTTWVASPARAVVGSPYYDVPYYDPFISAKDASGKSWVIYIHTTSRVWGGTATRAQEIRGQRVYATSRTLDGGQVTICSSFEIGGAGSASSNPELEILGVGFETGSRIHVLVKTRTHSEAIYSNAQKIEYIAADWNGAIVRSLTTVASWAENPQWGDATFLATGVTSPNDKAFVLSYIANTGGSSLLNVALYSLNKEEIVYRSQMWDMTAYNVRSGFGQTMDCAWVDGSGGNKGIIPLGFIENVVDGGVSKSMPRAGVLSFLPGSPGLF